MKADFSGPEHPAVSAPDLADRRSRAFLLLYALAYAGGAIAYVPFLVFLLPAKVAAIAGDERIAVLSQAAFWGAAAASLANICAGVLTDRAVARGGGRRPWLLGGAAATVLSYGGLHLADTPGRLIAAVLVFQVALNFMLAPLAAVAADEVPDAQKGLLGGLLGAAHPFGHLTGALVTGVAGLGAGSRLLFVAGVAAAAVLPFAATRRAPVVVVAGTEAAKSPPPSLAAVWIARFLVQIAGAVLFSYLLFYFEGVRGGEDAGAGPALAGRVGRLSGLSMSLAAVAGLAAGWASDRLGARRPFLSAAALAAAGGLAILALQPTWAYAPIGYGLFACGCGVFLALSATYAMQILPSPERRGRDLAIVNLTNTIPNMIAPALAYATIGTGGFRLLLLGLAGSTTAAAVLVLMRGRRG